MTQTNARETRQPASIQADGNGVRDVRYAMTSVRPGTAFERDRWNGALLELNGHLLQSWQWGELKARHGWQVERVTVEGAWGKAMAQVLFRHRGPLSLAYVPRGPVMAGDKNRAFEELTRVVDRVARKHRAITLIVEPNGRLGLTGTYRQAGYIRGPEPFQPARTVKVPLLPDPELMEQFHSKNRYNIRLALRRGVTVEHGNSEEDLRAFYALLEDTAKRNRFGVHTYQYYRDALDLFGKDAALLFAKINGENAAGVVTARFGDEAIYLYGASSTTVRADGAAFLLQYEAMRWAREQGAKRYDLWGIPAEDPEKLPEDATGMTRSQGEDQRGLYNFKVRFGGEIVAYPPTMERRYHRLLAVAARRMGVLRG